MTVNNYLVMVSQLGINGL